MSSPVVEAAGRSPSESDSPSAPGGRPERASTATAVVSGSPPSPSSLPFDAPDGAALDLHEELCTPKPKCTCGPEHLRLRSDLGELVPMRGRKVNHCEYCARLAAVENTEMLALDAMEGDAPQVWCVLTTRLATVDMRLFYRARAKLLKAIRLRFPDCEYAALLEFTTGYGKNSGGRRRPHWNLLLKGVREADVGQLRELIERIWCPRVDALPEGQHVGTVREAEGLMRYIALHFLKESQKPPAGFSGQRFNCSRGYFTGCTRAVARARARESLRRKRELWAAEKAGYEGGEALAVAEDSYRESLKRVWVVATATGAWLSPTQHNPRRMVLPSDRLSKEFAHE